MNPAIASDPAEPERVVEPGRLAVALAGAVAELAAVGFGDNASRRSPEAAATTTT
jgi:hypothetical protein